MNSSFVVTNELHNDVTDLYEEMVENNTQEALDKIDLIMTRLKHLKTNLKEDEV